MPATGTLRSDTARAAAPLPRASVAPVAAPTLRILTFLHSLAPGGVERVALRLHAAWIAAGAEAQLVLADGSCCPSDTPANLHVLGTTCGEFARFVVLMVRLPGLIAAQRPDILFCAGNTYAAVAVCLKLLLGRRCPVIIGKISNDLVRTDMPPLRRWWYRRWLWLQGRCIDRFVGMAPAMRAEIAALVGVREDRISIIEDPALTDADRIRLASARTTASRTRSGRHFLAVGRLVAQKNFALLLDAFALVVRPGDTLTILGEGGERAALEAQVARLALDDAVTLPGHVEPLDPWLANADAFVLSSDYEGVPAVVIEALAAGLPIVATDCCVSMGDLLGQGRLGWIVPAGDAGAMADAMGGIADRPCAAAAQRLAAGRFTIEHATERYLTMMRAAALNTGRSGRAPTPAASPNRSPRRP